MIWCCFSFDMVGTPEIIDRRMDGVKYRYILEDNLQKSVEKMWFINEWWSKQDNDPKHTAKATQKWFVDKDIDVLKWPSQSPDLNPIKNVWRILKNKIQARRPSNLKELRIFSNEKWDKIPLKCCQNLIQIYKNHLKAVIAAKWGPNKYKLFFSTVQILFSPPISWNTI